MAKKRNKIFVLGDSVYRSEATFLKNIKSMVSRQNFETSWAAKITYQIFEVSESGTLVDYKARVDAISTNLASLKRILNPNRGGKRSKKTRKMHKKHYKKGGYNWFSPSAAESMGSSEVNKKSRSSSSSTRKRKNRANKYK
jgi:putative cell wall-binding protein